MGLSHFKHEEQHMKRTSTLLVAVLVAFALPVLAQPNTPNIDQRQANQQQRIDQGVKSGELTGKEAARLEKGQERVQNMETKAKADGKVTPKERERIENAQNKESKKIHKEKHDRQHDRNHDGKKDRPHKDK
jgi:uncharacterized membrane protein YebE (DUF533 family)